jgi:hypothetical protein
VCTWVYCVSYLILSSVSLTVKCNSSLTRSFFHVPYVCQCWCHVFFLLLFSPVLLCYLTAKCRHEGWCSSRAERLQWNRPFCNGYVNSSSVSTKIYDSTTGCCGIFCDTHNNPTSWDTIQAAQCSCVILVILVPIACICWCTLYAACIMKLVPCAMFWSTLVIDWTITSWYSFTSQYLL